MTGVLSGDPPPIHAYCKCWRIPFCFKRYKMSKKLKAKIGDVYMIPVKIVEVDDNCCNNYNYMIAPLNEEDGDFIWVHRKIIEGPEDVTLPYKVNLDD